MHAITCLHNVPSGDAMSSTSFNGATSGYMKIHVCDRRNLYSSECAFLFITSQQFLHTTLYDQAFIIIRHKYKTAEFSLQFPVIPSLIDVVNFPGSGTISCDKIHVL